jgi:hypothetical protein
VKSGIDTGFLLESVLIPLYNALTPTGESHDTQSTDQITAGHQPRDASGRRARRCAIPRHTAP